MHCNVSSTVEDRLLELLHEQSFTTDFTEGGGKPLIAARRQTDELDSESRMRSLERLLHVLRLPHRETALARRDPDRSGRHNDLTKRRTAATWRRLISIDCVPPSRIR